MTDKITPPAADGTQEMQGNLAGTRGPHFGNEYDSHDARKPALVGVGQAETGGGRANGGVGIDPIPATHAPGEDIPDDSGRRGYVDQRTGEVHGSGADAGGGAGGQDYDPDTPGGSNEAPDAAVTSDSSQ